jgi:Fe-S-cluster containining protein
VQTYFTFPDGGLKYDCPTCGQHCCRGKGFAFAPSELVPLLTKAPELSPHLFLRAGGTLGAVDLTDGCWFLAGDGNCSLEVKHGRSIKPSTCRLFPFNRVFLVGDIRVVDMNSVLCPLQPASGDGVRWDELTREIDELAGNPLIDVEATKPLDLPEDWLAQERAQPDPLSQENELAREWARVLGFEQPEEFEGRISPLLKLLAPSLRFNTLFRKEGGGPYSFLMGMLPRRLRALGFLAALAARAGGKPSLRSMTELWTQQAPTLDVLVSWNEPVHMLRPEFDASVPAQLQPALGALLAGAFRGGKTLGELIDAATKSLEPPLRPLAVAVAASQMKTLFPFG